MLFHTNTPIGVLKAKADQELKKKKKTRSTTRKTATAANVSGDALDSWSTWFEGMINGLTASVCFVIDKEPYKPAPVTDGDIIILDDPLDGEIRDAKDDDRTAIVVAPVGRNVVTGAEKPLSLSLPGGFRAIQRAITELENVTTVGEREDVLTRNPNLRICLHAKPGQRNYQRCLVRSEHHHVSAMADHIMNVINDERAAQRKPLIVLSELRIDDAQLNESQRIDVRAYLRAVYLAAGMATFCAIAQELLECPHMKAYIRAPVYCLACTKSGNVDNQLFICDGCNAGYHRRCAAEADAATESRLDGFNEPSQDGKYWLCPSCYHARPEGALPPSESHAWANGCDTRLFANYETLLKMSSASMLMDLNNPSMSPDQTAESIGRVIPGFRDVWKKVMEDETNGYQDDGELDLEGDEDDAMDAAEDSADEALLLLSHSGMEPHASSHPGGIDPFMLVEHLEEFDMTTEFADFLDELQFADDPLSMLNGSKYGKASNGDTLM